MQNNSLEKNDYLGLLDQLRKRMISMDFEGISVGMKTSPILSFKALIVREAEIILLTFSRGKSILLLNCSLDVQ